MKFGEYLRNARDKAGWTQPEAAAKIGIEQSYLSKVETGKSYPSEDVFDELVKAYSINVDAMRASVKSDDLTKLSEISSVRASILKQKQTETRYQRSWMMAGLVMIMFGSGLLIAQSEVNETSLIIHRYESQGIIYADDPVLIFDFLKQQGDILFSECLKRNAEQTDVEKMDTEPCRYILTEAEETIAARTKYKTLDTVEYLGPSFVRTLDDGNRRRYKLVDRIKTPHQSWANYMHAIGIALLVGGFVSCFYISRHWR